MTAIFAAQQNRISESASSNIMASRQPSPPAPRSISPHSAALGDMDLVATRLLDESGATKNVGASQKEYLKGWKWRPTRRNF
jgi:hypothetical protein